MNGYVYLSIIMITLSRTVVINLLFEHNNIKNNAFRILDRKTHNKG